MSLITRRWNAFRGMRSAHREISMAKFSPIKFNFSLNRVSSLPLVALLMQSSLANPYNSASNLQKFRFFPFLRVSISCY